MFQKVLFVLIFSFQLVAYPCDNKKFNIVISKSISFRMILEKLAQECLLSVVYEDRDSQKILEDKNIILNFYQAKLSDILKVGFDALDLNYSFQDNVIRINRLKTKTFFIHYIATSRVASSNTNIVFSQDSNQDGNYNASLTSRGENTHQKIIEMASNQDEASNKSGSKIYSLDAVDFWGDLQKELHSIVFHDNDKYIPNKDQQSITINKGSGFVTIVASPSQIARAQAYIEALNKKLKSQVLIDVNIFTITHNKTNTTGIDWSRLYTLGIQNNNNSPLFGVNNSGWQYGINIFSQDLSIGDIIKFLNTYGKVTSVSNPKILTLNNQPALISAGNIIRYMQNYVYQTTNTSSTLQNTRQQYPSVFSGVLLDITPSIEGNFIILKINPSVTSTKDSRIENEPDALKSPPNLSTKQLSSIVRIKNNQRVILGGLINRLKIKQDKRFPVLGYIPVVKYLFSYTKFSDEMQEMIIVITPKIISFKEQDED